MGTQCSKCENLNKTENTNVNNSIIIGETPMKIVSLKGGSTTKQKMKVTSIKKRV